MRAAVLCPGPSLLTTWGNDPLPVDGGSGDRHDVVIAVNRAANSIGHDYDWFAAYDSAPLKQCTHVPLTGVFTGITHWRAIQDKGVAPLLKHLEYIDSNALLTAIAPKGRRNWTANGALWLACHLGATVIDVYGMDHHGRDYCDGTTMNGTEARWVKEAHEFALVRAALEKRGVIVNRHLPAGADPPTPGRPEPELPPTQKEGVACLVFECMSIPEKRMFRRLHGVAATRRPFTKQKLDAVLTALGKET